MLKSLLSLFLQSSCPLCERPADDRVCEYCQRQLQRCQLKNSCQFWQGDLPVFVWGVYGGQLRRAIAALKYDAHPQLGELMGYWLGKAWLDSPLYAKAKKMTVVPIPLHPNKLQERGFNQAELIGRSFCQFTGYSLQKQGLERMRETKAMFGLSALERKQNLSNAFGLGKGFQRRHPKSPVLLLDDIYTTGTTVREAAKILHQERIQVFGVVAIATPQK
ncbi:MAG: ComF family protein [Xenococcaceae cyanobacterium]